jgi:hypothetical protein
LEDAMTEGEALALKPGDAVEFMGPRGWEPGIVGDAWVHPRSGLPYVTVRRPGATRAGHKLPAFSRSVLRLRRPVNLDPLPANVFADWLDDHDFPEAAAALRRAFPLGPPAEIASRNERHQ